MHRSKRCGAGLQDFAVGTRVTSRPRRIRTCGFPAYGSPYGQKIETVEKTVSCPFLA